MRRPPADSGRSASYSLPTPPFLLIRFPVNRLGSSASPTSLSSTLPRNPSAPSQRRGGGKRARSSNGGVSTMPRQPLLSTNFHPLSILQDNESRAGSPSPHG